MSLDGTTPRASLRRILVYVLGLGPWVTGSGGLELTRRVEEGRCGPGDWSGRCVSDLRESVEAQELDLQRRNRDESGRLRLGAGSASEWTDLTPGEVSCEWRRHLVVRKPNQCPNNGVSRLVRSPQLWNGTWGSCSTSRNVQCP